MVKELEMQLPLEINNLLDTEQAHKHLSLKD